MSEKNGYNSKIISAVKEVNQNQKKIFLHKIIKRFGEDLSGLVFAVWGLSFKPETDDMRESPAIYIVNELISRGAKIKAYDPKAMNAAKETYLKNATIFYGENKYEVVKDADALILLTEWKEFRSPDFKKINKLMNTSIVFDARNQYIKFNLDKLGFEYFQIGKI